jgi:hypothetical protein
MQTRKLRMKVAGVTITCLLAGAGAAGAISPATSLFGVARHGADDPAGDNRGGHGNDDPAGHARHGADDPAGDNRGGHGNDDPAGHA